MNDKIAASILARLLAKGLLVGIWIPHGQSAGTSFANTWMLFTLGAI